MGLSIGSRWFAIIISLFILNFSVFFGVFIQEFDGVILYIYLIFRDF